MVGENPTPYEILALWAVNGLSIVYWVVHPINFEIREDLLVQVTVVVVTEPDVVEVDTRR